MATEVAARDAWALSAYVPDRIFTLAIEADDATAEAEHTAFADRCLPVLLRAAGDDRAEAERLRTGLIAQLGALRQSTSAGGIRYLGAISGLRAERSALVLIAIAATTMSFPQEIDAANVLAALLRHQYPEAVVAEFKVASGTAVGMQRIERRAAPSGTGGWNAGLAQALVPFPDASLLATVTGYSYLAQDIDIAAVIAATIACRLRASPAD